MPVAVNPGDHTVSVIAEGRQPFSKKVTLAEKENAVVAAEFALAADAPSVDNRAEVEAKRTVPLVTWIAGGGAVALAAGGVVSFAIAGSAASSGQAACAKTVTCSSSDKSKVHRFDDLALGLWIGAGASAAFGVTYWFVNRPKTVDPNGAVGLTLTPTGGAFHATF
jgi:hypothetical protein